MPRLQPRMSAARAEALRDERSTGDAGGQDAASGTDVSAAAGLSSGFGNGGP